MAKDSPKTETKVQKQLEKISEYCRKILKKARRDLQQQEELLNSNEALKAKHLRVNRKGGHYDYYLCDAANRNGTYVQKKNLKPLMPIAQRDYAETVQKSAEQWLQWANQALETMPHSTLQDAMTVSEGRAPLVTTYVTSDEEYLKQWLSKPYAHKAIGPDKQEIITDKGERVRSKSEKMIADRLNQMGIPYKYECPLTVKGGIELHPDFTLLDIAGRREIYVEHSGMVDDPDYARGMVQRLRLYWQSGLLLGRDIIFTFESSHTALDLQQFEEYVRSALENRQPE